MTGCKRKFNAIARILSSCRFCRCRVGHRLHRDEKQQDNDIELGQIQHPANSQNNNKIVGKKTEARNDQQKDLVTRSSLKKRKMLKELNSEGQAANPNLIESESAEICRLCNREQPLYFYQQEEIIKRLPERSLTKLNLQMKQDLQAKLAYLKYLRVSAKFCDPCECPRRKVHKYCLTAQIIQNQRIYCDKCGSQYNFFVQQENLCSAKLITLVMKYFLMVILLFSITTGFLILDGFMKTRYAKTHPEESEKL